MHGCSPGGHSVLWTVSGEYCPVVRAVDLGSPDSGMVLIVSTFLEPVVVTTVGDLEVDVGPNGHAVGSAEKI